MAAKALHICDKCKREEITEKYSSPEGWKQVTIQLAGYGNKKEYEFCGNCSKDLGLVDEKGKEQPILSAEDRLLDAIGEIVADAIADNQG